jgi:uncharacterized protein GlcG (DUF336 family)/catechol 2,3-dioxygenase-like lactoylglutathione lyase family enzyme
LVGSGKGDIENKVKFIYNFGFNMLALKDAQRIIAAAEKKAVEIGQPMNIAVADAGANLVAHVRMDRAWIGSIDISIKKAYTACAFDIATKELGVHSQPGGQFFGIHASNNGRIMIFAGGIPLKQNGILVGAIGVSGGSGEQDHAVAETGSQAFTVSEGILHNNITAIEGIFHCNVNCTDLDRSLAFYEMLGFKVVLDFTEGMSSQAMAEAFGMSQARLRGVHLVLGDNPTATRIDPKTQGQPYPHLYHTGIARICLRTNNINQVYENLQAKGVKFLSKPQTLPGTKVSIVCLIDPDGTVLELLEGTF